MERREGKQGIIDVQYSTGGGRMRHAGSLIEKISLKRRRKKKMLDVNRREPGQKPHRKEERSCMSEWKGELFVYQRNRPRSRSGSRSPVCEKEKM